jgi:hypothetical protein
MRAAVERCLAFEFVLAALFISRIERGHAEQGFRGFRVAGTSCAVSL